MPELPEAEITKRKLEPLLKGKRILFVGGSLGKGGNLWKKISGVERRGKAILIWLEPKLGVEASYLLAFHMRMSGKLLMVNRNHHDKYIRRRFQLSDGKDLAFHDVRRFGVVWYGKAKKVLQDNYFKTLGEDALAISLEGLKKLLNAKSITPLIPLTLRGTKIKSFLLNQKNIAGIGNICADEILWKAKIHPERKISDLNDNEIKTLWSSLRAVLLLSIKLGGSSMRDWFHPDGDSGGYFEKRAVYGRAGKKSFFFKRLIYKNKVAGRGTYFCKVCQKK